MKNSATVDNSKLTEQSFKVFSVPITHNKPAHLQCDQEYIDLKKKTITCLMGKSGVGKTTLMEYCINFFMKENIKVAYHNQGYALLENKTVLQNMMLVFQLQNKEASLQKINDILTDVHLERDIHKKVHALSEGMKQRLNIAKTLIQDVDIYCLDEPFSAQHYAMRRQLCQVVKKWTDQKTVFVITHQKEDSSFFNGDLLHFKSGRILNVQYEQKFFTQDLMIKEEQNDIPLIKKKEVHPKKQKISKIFAQILIIASLIAVWGMWIKLFKIPPFLAPPPSAVWQTFCAEFHVLTYHFFQTIYPLVSGIIFSFLFSTILAISLFKHRRLTEILDPFFVVIQSIPVFLILPLLLYFTGNGLFPKIMIVSLNFFFPLLSGTVKGLQSLPKIWELQKKIINPRPLNFFLHIRVYYAKNILWQGFRVSLVHAPLTVLSCDWIGASSGLGYIIMVSYSQLDLALMMAALLYVVFLCIILNSFAKKIDSLIESST